MLNLLLVPRKQTQLQMKRCWRVFAQICTLKCRGSLIIGMFLVVEAIEATGGPSLIDRVAPAEWLVERGRDAARPYLAKARKDTVPQQ